MDTALIRLISENVVALALALYVMDGIAAALTKTPSETRFGKTLTAVGVFLGQIVDVFEGALDAAKPKLRNGKKPDYMR